VTNNNGVPTSGFQCNACNTHTAQVSDDDGGFLRIFVGQYYSCGTTPALTPVPAASATPTFYFAEGFTGNGFTETLSLFMPRQSGTATIDYFLKAGHIDLRPIDGRPGGGRERQRRRGLQPGGVGPGHAPGPGGR